MSLFARSKRSCCNIDNMKNTQDLFEQKSKNTFIRISFK